MIRFLKNLCDRISVLDYSVETVRRREMAPGRGKAHTDGKCQVNRRIFTLGCCCKALAIKKVDNKATMLLNFLWVS